MRTTAELQEFIGKEAWLSVEEFQVRVQIEDAKTAYGNVRVRVEPVGGIGSKWVSLDRVTVIGA